MNKQTLLQQTDPTMIINYITSKWPLLLDEEEQELCLEEIYDLVANSATKPKNFNLLSNDEKAQHEIDVDMVLITIDFHDIGKHIFKDKQNEDILKKMTESVDQKSLELFNLLFCK